MVANRVFMFHNLSRESSDPDRISPDESWSRHYTDPMWPESVFRTFPSGRNVHSLIKQSPLPDTTVPGESRISRRQFTGCLWSYRVWMQWFWLFHILIFWAPDTSSPDYSCRRQFTEFMCPFNIWIYFTFCILSNWLFFMFSLILSSTWDRLLKN